MSVRMSSHTLSDKLGALPVAIWPSTFAVSFTNLQAGSVLPFLRLRGLVYAARAGARRRLRASLKSDAAD